MTPERAMEMRKWVAFNLRKGCTPLSIRETLRDQGYSAEDLRAIVGDVFYSPDYPVDFDALTRIKITERLGKVEGLKRIPTTKVQIYTWENFLTDAECDRLIHVIDTHRRPSTVTDEFADKYVRTSDTSDLGILGDPFIYRIDQKVSQAIGLHWSYADSNQGQRYDIGQEFKAHHDYFQPNSQEFQQYCQHQGQRTWTFLIYLNNVDAGGATRFRKIDKMIYPKRGMAVVWNNLNSDGSINPYTLHHGMKVREGCKYVVTKWFRELGWGQMFVDKDDLLTVDTSVDPEPAAA